MSNWTECEQCGMTLRVGEACPSCVQKDDITIEEFAGTLQKAFPNFMNEMMTKKGKPGYRSMTAKNWCRLLGELL